MGCASLDCQGKRKSRIRNTKSREDIHSDTEEVATVHFHTKYDLSYLSVNNEENPFQSKSSLEEPTHAQESQGKPIHDTGSKVVYQAKYLDFVSTETNLVQNQKFNEGSKNIGHILHVDLS